MTFDFSLNSNCWVAFWLYTAYATWDTKDLHGFCVILGMNISLLFYPIVGVQNHTNSPVLIQSFTLVRRKGTSLLEPVAIVISNSLCIELVWANGAKREYSYIVNHYIKVLKKAFFCLPWIWIREVTNIILKLQKHSFLIYTMERTFILEFLVGKMLASILTFMFAFTSKNNSTTGVAFISHSLKWKGLELIL